MCSSLREAPTNGRGWSTASDASSTTTSSACGRRDASLLTAIPPPPGTGTCIVKSRWRSPVAISKAITDGTIRRRSCLQPWRWRRCPISQHGPCGWRSPCPLTWPWYAPSSASVSASCWRSAFRACCGTSRSARTAFSPRRSSGGRCSSSNGARLWPIELKKALMWGLGRHSLRSDPWLWRPTVGAGWTRQPFIQRRRQASGASTARYGLPVFSSSARWRRGGIRRVRRRAHADACARIDGGS
jgi:hypothetical protein